MALAVEDRHLAEAEGALEVLRAEVARIQEFLPKELRPRCAAAQRQAAELRDEEGSLKSQLEVLSRNRQEATEQLGSITKRQLAEIKQLLRSPPDLIRRTLVAAFMLLHSERFRGRTTIQFDEQKDWPRCQRMLADEGFIGLILNFDPSVLSEVPHVPRHVASHFFGLSSGLGGHSVEDSRDSCVASKDTMPIRRSPSAMIKRSSTMAAPKPPLDEQTVAHASAPCGALVRWMLELVQECIHREQLEKELVGVQFSLVQAEAAAAELEGDVAVEEAALCRARDSAAEQERQIAALKEKRQAAKRATQDLKKLDGAGVPRSATSPSKLRMGSRPANKVEVDLQGTMAHIESQLASLRVPFGKSAVKVLVGHVEQALVLPKIADVLKENKRSLKVVIEGHQDGNEKEETDIGRSLAVYQWLVEGALCPPGMIRVKGCGASQGQGRCAVPVPIHELVASSGPLSQEIAAISPETRPGLFFDNSSASLMAESRSIATAMGLWLSQDGDTVVRVEGHTDKDESDDLASQRARAVREVFVGLGVRSNMVKLTSCKNLHPVSRLHGALNRRVEVHAE